MQAPPDRDHSSSPLPDRPQLCAVVPLSTTPPKRRCAYQMQITFDPPLPDPYSTPTVWVKGDMVQTVAFHRLRLLFSGWSEGQRVHDVRVLDPATLDRVRECVRSGLGL